MAPSAELLVDSVALIPTAGWQARPAQFPAVKHWAPTRRVVEIAQAQYQRTLEVAENFNPGWTASVEGQPLESLRVDAWRQGFVVPAGMAGDVELAYAPDRPYRSGMLVGMLAAFVAIALALVPGTGGSAPVHPVNSPRAQVIGAGGWALLAGGPLALAAAAGIGLALRAFARRAGQRRALAVARGCVLGCGALLGVTVALLPWPERTAHEALYTGLSLGLAVVTLAAVTGASALVDRGGTGSTS
jgi:arabinofuranan 3-O-arabinosyltransferase